jgi:hypothetical protein
MTDDIKLNVNFHKPQMIQTESEKEDSTIKLLDAGLKSKSEAIQDLRGVDENRAKEILKKIVDDEFGSMLEKLPLKGENNESEANGFN